MGQLANDRMSCKEGDKGSGYVGFSITMVHVYYLFTLQLRMQFCHRGLATCS